MAHTQNTISELFDRPNAAAYLGVAPATLAVWACTGRYSLRFVKIGRLVKYRKQDLDLFIEERLSSSHERRHG